MLEKRLKLSKKITIGPSVSRDELQALSDKGFKTIINLSRKKEYKQPLLPTEEGEIASELGMDYIHLPMSMSSIKDPQIKEFCESIDDAQGPVYVHCLMGQRTVPLALIAHALRKKISAGQVIVKAKSLGLDWNAPMIRTMVERYVGRSIAAAEAS